MQPGYYPVGMNCIVTAGPTYEPLDAVRRLTNFSTGRLGSELANRLVHHGHSVILLIGQPATHGGERHARETQTFTTTTDLRQRLKTLASQSIDAVFHAAAVSDFTFGKVWVRSATGEKTEIRAGKIPTREGPLLAELLPTPKIIAELRSWYPRARLVGWKFEVDASHEDVIRSAERQLAECRTDACVANGPAYGPGFGLVRGTGDCLHLPDALALFDALERSLQRPLHPA